MLMQPFKALKALARTRSASFTRDFLASNSTADHDRLACVPWRSGDGRPVYYRPGTVDVEVLYNVLFKPGRKGEYWLPPQFEPKLILDIGGNIGATSRYLSYRFPRAGVHAFEPVAENCALLERNVAGTRVTVHPYGLGERSGSFEFRLAPGGEANRGGYSLARPAAEGGRVARGEVRAVRQVLQELAPAAIDLIKIDVEGAEHEILNAFPDDVLANTAWIYGELHSEPVDPRLAFGLLAKLAAWFDIEVHKSLRKRNWFFDACNRRDSRRFRGFRRER